MEEVYNFSVSLGKFLRYPWFGPFWTRHDFGLIHKALLIFLEMEISPRCSEYFCHQHRIYSPIFPEKIVGPFHT